MRIVGQRAGRTFLLKQTSLLRTLQGGRRSPLRVAGLQFRTSVTTVREVALRIAHTHAVKQLFEQFDQNRDDVLEAAEFTHAIAALDPESSDNSDTVSALLKYLDLDHDDLLTHADFYRALELFECPTIPHLLRAARSFCHAKPSPADCFAASAQFVGLDDCIDDHIAGAPSLPSEIIFLVTAPGIPAEAIANAVAVSQRLYRVVPLQAHLARPPALRMLPPAATTTRVDELVSRPRINADDGGASDRFVAASLPALAAHGDSIIARMRRAHAGHSHNSPHGSDTAPLGAIVGGPDPLTPAAAAGCSWTYGHRVIPSPDSLRLTVLLREMLHPFSGASSSGAVVTDFPRNAVDLEYIRTLRRTLARATAMPPAVRLVMVTCSEDLSLRRQAELAQEARNEVSIAAMFPLHRADHDAYKRYHSPAHAAAQWRRWVALRGALQDACPRDFDFTAVTMTPAMNDAAVVSAVRGELERQRTRDLPPDMVAALETIPRPDTLLRNARGSLIVRIEDAVTRNPELAEEVMALIEDKFNGAIHRMALGGLVVVRCSDPLLHNEEALRLLLSVLTERGYSVTLEWRRQPPADDVFKFIVRFDVSAGAHKQRGSF